MNRYGIYSTNVGELSCFGPIFRLHYTEEIRVNMCLFCYENIDYIPQPGEVFRCNRCKKPTMLDLNWLKDANQTVLNIGSCVKINKEKVGFSVVKVGFFICEMKKIFVFPL